jgi:hypothetical protein
LAKHSVSVSPHLPYSPDPAPLRFPPLSQAEDNPEGEGILIRHEDAKNITRQMRANPPKAYNTCIGRWKSLSLLHIVWRIVIWKREPTVISKCFSFPATNITTDISD